MLIAIFEIICQSLDFQQPFQEAEVRDSECLVYEAESQPDRLTFLLLRLEGALPPYPLTAFHSVRYPRGSRPTDIALRAPSRSPPGGLRTAFAPL